MVQAMVQRHLEGRADLGMKLWTILCFERWLRLLPTWSAPAAALAGSQRETS
jgi:hypothetical protein